MCSFQGTNCDNHSIMVIYGLKWTFPSDWRLSFSFTLWAQVDSNHRPHAYQACALTSWAISPQWRWRDSNSRPPACKAGALPTELHPHLIWRPPALPHRLQCSTIGRLGLNRRVRDGNGCVPQAHRHQKFRDTKVSTQSREKGCRKLASIKTFYQGCICDAAATEELSFRGALTHFLT